MSKNKKQQMRSTLRGNNQKQNNKVIRVPLYIAPNFGSMSEEILEVLKNTPFNKISFPIGTYRYYIQDDIAPDDERISTIGYIKSYDAESQEFTAVLFKDETISRLKEIGELFVEAVCSTYSDKFNKIVRLNIVPMGDDDEEEYDDVDQEDEQETESVAETEAVDDDANAAPTYVGSADTDI